MTTLSKKFLFILVLSLFLSILLAYSFSYILYEKFYVDNIEEKLLKAGMALATDYNGGSVTDEFIDQVDWYNEKSDFEVFAVRNPRELAACIPFEVDYDTLIGSEQREKLIENKPVKSIGYVNRFDRKVISVIIPLVEKQRLQGIIYLYFPLADISELTSDLTIYWSVGSVIFLLVLSYFGTKWIRFITSPLQEMKKAAERMSEGDYSTRVQVATKDEIGQLASTFNEMAEAIDLEDERTREFLATVSHELRTPLSYIKGYGEAITTGMIKKEDEKRQYLQIIVRETNRMERIVNDLLDLVKMEKDSFSVSKFPLVLAETIHQTVEGLIPAANEKGIQVKTNLDYDVIINGDEGRIEQVVFNLMDNSLRYTESGGTITVNLIQQGEEAILQIKDTGIGIPSEDIGKLTERFYRVNKARTRSDGGTGLGLSIVDKIIKLHNGNLRIESELGVGTSITIDIPILQEF
ncbi:signal transduction histidine kinase [Oikeobacillus pervagus]|uniref:histidine kinase n=1 Tax=Oikeobacillus pervagus TaxID=1325931 RepID=A0AAJ1WG87_9BACI|nr:HAMP domain-containing sensor histidine kinase [Oikeobacillus pervagus]MDQ0214772.1 signal transduction histidine kinase [Oikeobacillus pervagus]